MVSVNGLRALIKHNVIKQLKKKYQNYNVENIDLILNKLNIDDLKQKGITNKVLLEVENKYKNRTRRNIFNGGMKRKHDDDEFIPIKRNLLGKTMGLLVGRPFNDKEYNNNLKIEHIKNLIAIDKDNKIDYERCKKQLERAEERMRQSEFRLKEEIESINKDENTNPNIMRDLLKEFTETETELGKLHKNALTERVTDKDIEKMNMLKTSLLYLEQRILNYGGKPESDEYKKLLSDVPIPTQIKPVQQSSSSSSSHQEQESRQSALNSRTIRLLEKQ